MSKFYVARLDRSKNGSVQKILFRSNSLTSCVEYISSRWKEANIYIFDKAGEIVEDLVDA